jgi:transcriptional regulator with PAS, ATPase and Fis domain
MKTLISWIAVNNDFSRESSGDIKVQKDGPTMGFHHHFFSGYDRHILLSSAKDDDTQLGMLLNALRREHPSHTVEFRHMDIRDVIDLREIRLKVEQLLVELKDDEVTAFISPGTPAMQTAWYLLHQQWGQGLSLVQTRGAKHTASGKPELIHIQAETSETPVSLLISQRMGNTQEATGDYRITASIQPLYDLARKAAETDAVPVLITGDSGTGKEHLAHFLHSQSLRASGPFITVNCSALSESLLESRLFGYVKGAFTGAERNTKGLFAEADGGTLFLDEIGDISPQFQQSLLRVLQSGEFLPVGSTKPAKVNVRLVAATHRDLRGKCADGTFRWDLYYRLAVLELRLPSLLERGPQEIREMLQHFIGQERKNLRKQRELTLSSDAKKALLAYAWPGNLREMENVIRMLYVICEGEVQPNHLPERLHNRDAQNGSLLLADVEQAHIQKVLRLTGGNQRQAAEALGIVLNTLKAKIKKAKG